jgi:chemotaxis protein histidine kinase CheA
VNDFMDEDLLQGFFSDVEESFYPQVSEAMELVRASRISDGVDMMMRPLHTIKGTSAFLNLGEVSRFTHAVEDLLKEVQSGSAKPDPTLLVQAVDMVFNMLDSARRNAPLEETGYGAVLERLNDKSTARPAAAVADTGGLEAEHLEGVQVIRVRAPRVHLPSQYRPLLDALRALPDGQETLIDLQGVRTINSTTWGGLREASERLRLSVSGMSAACRSTFYAWGFHLFIASAPDEAEYWRQRREI